MGGRSTDSIDSRTWKRIQFKAGKTIGRYGFTADDREDIEQTLALHVLIQQRRYDSRRSAPQTFDSRIIDSKLATMIERQRAAKRRAKSVVSFDDDYEDDDDANRYPLHETYSNDDFRRALGTFRRTEEEQLDLEIDVRRAVEGLPAALRLVADLLSSVSVTDAAKSLGVPRTTLDYWRQQIRRRLLDLGLENYL